MLGGLRNGDLELRAQLSCSKHAKARTKWLTTTIVSMSFLPISTRSEAQRICQIVAGHSGINGVVAKDCHTSVVPLAGGLNTFHSLCRRGQKWNRDNIHPRSSGAHRAGCRKLSKHSLILLLAPSARFCLPLKSPQFRHEWVRMPATDITWAPRVNGGTRINRIAPGNHDSIKHHAPPAINPQRMPNMIPK